MINEIRTIYNGLNKGFDSKFRVGSRIRQETPEEDPKDESNEMLWI